MLCELWEDDSGGHCFFERAKTEAEYRMQLRQNGLEAGEKKLVWTVEASTWEEAMQLLYDRKDFGRYRPWGEAEHERIP